MKSKIKQFAEFISNPALQKKITIGLAIANIFVLSLYASGWTLKKPTTTGAQGNRRVVTKLTILKNEPVEISNVKVKGKSVRLGNEFEEEADWLKGVEFKLKNKSDKSITYVVLNVDFPETKDTGTPIMHWLYLGHNPDSESMRPALYLKPDESINISLAPEFDTIKKTLERREPIDSIHKIQVSLDQVIFEDNTLYSGGGIFKRNPDPNSPRKWVLMTSPLADPQN